MDSCIGAGGTLLGQHGVVRSVLLHLTPGAIAVLTYLYIFVPLTEVLALPRQFAFVLMDVVVLLPLLLLFLFHLGRRRNGNLTLDGIVANRRSLPARQLAPLVAGLFIWAVLVIALLSWMDDLLLERVFYWVPIASLPETDVGGYPPAILVGTYLTSVVIVGVAVPIVEELYFRGFLLPRVDWMGRWAPVWHTVLFTCYHFWSPWRFVTRVVFSLPVVYAVWRTQSISVGIWWHCLGNVVAELLAFAAVMQVIAGTGRAL